MFKHISVYYCFVARDDSDEVENNERTEKMNKYSYDNTVDKLISLGITSVENMQYWEKCLAGTEPLDKDNVRTIFNRLIEKIK